ncbi:MAG TPA: hypothetical protein VGB54_00935 [Allosphingosinicella sp.]|jgi:TPR repeat protein
MTAIALSGAIMLPACSFTGYAGINFGPGMAPRHLQQLAARAKDGDARAHYALGLLYEGGQGVVRNLPCSAKLYEIAASGPAGLPEARARLEALRPLVEQDPERERALRWC